jgi:dihydrofolate synthase/folylpolyglutamate synthase
MPRAYASIKSKLKLPKIIHIIGTNGKGTTGRFLASALYKAGYNTGHYTSPHILEFRERIWLNGEDTPYDTLEDAHSKLLTLLDTQTALALSYFEYTTLLAMVVYEMCDYVVLEAGLGGEHDATAVFANILSVITPIDKDHEAFLGNTITEIATTKLNAVTKQAVVAKQPHLEVLSLCNKISQEKHIPFYLYNTQLTDKDIHNITTLADTLHLPPYLQDNLALSIAVLNLLGIAYTTDSFQDARLFGRLTRLRKNILVDVGHNTLAAQSIQKSLAGTKYILVYNSYEDKNYAQILAILQPIIEHVEIIDIDEKRVVRRELLERTLHTLSLSYKDFTSVDTNKEYLVFGSFCVVENFLRRYDG